MDVLWLAALLPCWRSNCEGWVSIERHPARAYRRGEMAETRTHQLLGRTPVLWPHQNIWHLVIKPQAADNSILARVPPLLRVLASVRVTRSGQWAWAAGTSVHEYSSRGSEHHGDLSTTDPDWRYLAHLIYRQHGSGAPQRMRNRDHWLALGSVPTTAKFNNIEHTIIGK